MARSPAPDAGSPDPRRSQVAGRSRAGQGGTGAAEARIGIRVRPGVTRPGVGGTYGPTDALLVAVREPAVDGRATQAALRALAAALGVRPGQVRLLRGQGSRDKLVAVTSPPADLGQRLASLRAGRPGAS